MKHIILIIAACGVAGIIGLVFFFSMNTASAPSTPPPTPSSAVTPTATTDNTAATTPVDYIGLTEEAAQQFAQQNNDLFRVVERDGEPLMMTEDYRPGRINAVVEYGIVTTYTVEGSESVDTYEQRPADDTIMQDPAVTSGQHDTIIGMSEAQAETYAAAQNVPFRIGFRDGQPLPLTRDYRPGRITASVQDDVVFEYTVE